MELSTLSTKLNNLYHGSGNSFLIFEEELPDAPDKLCTFGVDGVLLLRGNLFTIYNADGGEAEMCGNGIRCMVRYLEEHGRRQELYTFQTLAGIVEAWHEGKLIGVKMPFPHFEGKQSVMLGEQERVADLYRVGVPHMVFFFEEIETLPIAEWSQPFCKNFNVNYVEVHPDSISVRTFERGVNRETLSCGTGATAAALATAARFDFPSPIIVHNQSKSSLTIRFSSERVDMIGPALSLNSSTLYTGPL